MKILYRMLWIICIIIFVSRTSCKQESGAIDFNDIEKALDVREKQTLTDIYKIKDVGEFANDISFFFVKNQDYKSELGFEKFNEYQKTLACIWELEGEINNGGFDQYYFNSAGNYAKFCEKALENVGSKEFLDILIQANSYFPNGKPHANYKKRWKQMDQWGESVSDKLDQLDNKYYNRNENIYKLIYDYAQKHKKQLFAKIKK